MPYELFGRTGLRVSKFFLGAMTFGEHGGVGAPLEECRRMVDTYAEVGGNVIDTAINYRGGASEEILGEVLSGRRDRFVVATKFTVSRDPTDANAAGSHRKNLRLSLETSLRRLNTDYIDVYWVHIHDRHTPMEETLRALDDAVRAGKILYIGVSDTPAWLVARAQTLAEWRDWTAFAGLQVPYSLLQRDIERDLLPMAEAFGMSVAAWSPLAGGVLSGKFTSGDALQGGTRVAADSIAEQDLSVARVVDAIAAEIGRGGAGVDPVPIKGDSPDHRGTHARTAERQPRCRRS
jgi:aryl-alcohol dehydrogenase-like predicted oxidoreductase